MGVEAVGNSMGGLGFLNRDFKRVRLTKKTQRPIVYGRIRGCMQPIPVRDEHDPLENWDPGIWRRVAWRAYGVSSSGGRLDQAGIN